MSATKSARRAATHHSALDFLYYVPMVLEDIGEFGLIRRLQTMAGAARLPQPSADELRLPLRIGIGDDTAAWDAPGFTELFTTDTMVDGVHFTQATSSWQDVGWKAMVANLSDIAAMGGSPFYALVTLGLPEGSSIASVEHLYEGLLDACAQYGSAIVGGDIVRSPVFFITIALTGATRTQPLLRSAARPRDHIAVTGALGGSAGGLRMLLEKLRLDPATASALRQAHLRPSPRLAEGRLLAANGVRCAMDISDGLVDDLGKLCLASGVAARLRADDVPRHPALRAAFPGQELSLALNSGEEYELVFAAPPDVMSSVCRVLPAGATVVGEVVSATPGQVTVEDRQGRHIPVTDGGWDHFRHSTGGQRRS